MRLLNGKSISSTSPSCVSSYHLSSLCLPKLNTSKRSLVSPYALAFIDRRLFMSDRVLRCLHYHSGLPQGRLLLQFLRLEQCYSSVGLEYWPRVLHGCSKRNVYIWRDRRCHTPRRRTPVPEQECPQSHASDSLPWFPYRLSVGTSSLTTLLSEGNCIHVCDVVD